MKQSMIPMALMAANPALAHHDGAALDASHGALWAGLALLALAAGLGLRKRATIKAG